MKRDSKIIVIILVVGALLWYAGIKGLFGDVTPVQGDN